MIEGSTAAGIGSAEPYSFARRWQSIPAAAPAATIAVFEETGLSQSYIALQIGGYKSADQPLYLLAAGWYWECQQFVMAVFSRGANFNRASAQALRPMGEKINSIELDTSSVLVRWSGLTPVWRTSS